MPDLAPFQFPEGALEASAEKAAGKDFYSDLSDEERAEEGLPPPPGKPGEGGEEDAGEGGDEDKGEVEEGAEADDEEDDDSPPAEDATGNLLEEIESLYSDLNERVGNLEKPETREEADELIEAALEHDDPIVRGMAERLQKSEQALADIQADAKQQRVARQIAQDKADFDAVKSTHTIAGRPMTDAHVEAIEDWMYEHQAAMKELSIEQITRVVFPDAVKTSERAAPRSKNGAAERGGAPTATVVTEGGTGGAPSGPWTPRANETIESAVEAAANRFGWKR